jgi:hypothetical protein
VAFFNLKLLTPPPRLHTMTMVDLPDEPGVVSSMTGGISWRTLISDVV